MSADSISLKQCSRKEQCVSPLGSWQPATTEYFRKASKEKSGLTSRCKACLHQGDAKYREDNPNHHKEWYEEQKRKNPDYIRDLYQKNKVDVIARATDWNKKHAEHFNAQQRKRYADNPEVRVKQRVFTDAYQDRLRKAGGKIPIALKRELYEEQEHRCGYCGQTLYMSIKYDCHIDHIIPLIRGGTNDKDNLVMCCKHCSASKGHKTLPEWFATRGW